MGEFGELKEPVDGRVEVVEEAPSRRRVLLSNGRSDGVDVLLSERRDVGDERAPHEWADLRVPVHRQGVKEHGDRVALVAREANADLTPAVAGVGRDRWFNHATA